MRNLWLGQVNYRFGKNAFLPYSIGRIWAYAKQFPGIAEQYQLAELLWEREPVSAVLKRMESRPPDVLALSTYIWNEQWNLRLARAVKELYPSCLVVLGGPQVPKRDTTDFLSDHPYVGVLVLGEGEQTFASILLQHAAGEVAQRVWPMDRVEDLSALPSPYLEGVFDVLMRRTDMQWQALQETNRGCPYQCTFCDWGSATYSTVRKFPMDLISDEIAWFAANGIELLYNCDANFGMLEQDEAIAVGLIAMKNTFGYPQKFRAAYAKKITERVFRVSKKLSDAGMSKGATISFQSLKAETLDAVKRLNPAQKQGLSEVFDRYNTAGISTYTEIILGLPEETYDSFADSIDQLLEAGQHHGLAIYPCMVLRNSEMGEQLYRERYGLKTVRCHQLLLHGTRPADDVSEWYDLVIETSTLPHEEWRRAYLFSWLVMALHCSGLTDQIARTCRELEGISYREFYETLLLSMEGRQDSVLGLEISRAKRMLNRVLVQQLPWRTSDLTFGGIEWPPEELAALHVAVTGMHFYEELRRWLIQQGWNKALYAWARQCHSRPRPSADLESWAREWRWYGRKGGKPQSSSANQERATCNE